MSRPNDDRELDKGLVPLTKEGLLIMLNDPTPSLSADEDLKMTLRRNHSINPEGLDRARSLMSHDIFKNFVSRDDTASLLVDGHCRTDGIGKTSPLSVWCASFVAALEQSPSLIVIHYFCGLNTSSGRALSGPFELVKSLIGQLLAHEDAEGPITTYLEQGTVEGASKDDIGCLCEILKELLLQLGKLRTVFCIIDNVCGFERKYWDNWLQYLTQVFETLHDLVDHEKQGGQIQPKVLLTSAEKSTQLVDKVTPRELISLRGQTMASGRMTGRDFGLNNRLLSPPISVSAPWSDTRAVLCREHAQRAHTGRCRRAGIASAG